MYSLRRDWEGLLASYRGQLPFYRDFILGVVAAIALPRAFVYFLHSQANHGLIALGIGAFAILISPRKTYVVAAALTCVSSLSGTAFVLHPRVDRLAVAVVSGAILLALVIVMARREVKSKGLHAASTWPFTNSATRSFNFR